ncbi:MAG TPA: hypothetical protein VHQ47_03930 [Phycisphaerae bacterium]|nr:hypothetical protein [Phycisphaerae bacterium]
MRGPNKIVRHVIRCDWRCKHCREVFGSERVAHYGEELPDLVKPTWFFASMALLDHLRDCQGEDHSDELRKKYGDDFLNHAQIYDWYNQHALIERHFLAEEEVE